MGYKDRSTSDEVLLLTNLCRHHEQTIAEMFAIQEPILRYATAMYFYINDSGDYITNLDNYIDPIDALETAMFDWEQDHGRKYTIDWEEL